MFSVTFINNVIYESTMCTNLASSLIRTPFVRASLATSSFTISIIWRKTIFPVTSIHCVIILTTVGT